MAFQERKWEHVWVEAFLDYVPSRGERPRAGDTWIPMDPSFKQYAFTGGMNLATNVAFDAQTLLDQAQQGASVNETEGWVQNLNQTAVQTGIEDYRSRLTDFVTAANPDATIGDVLGTQKILPEALPYLPSTLPNRVVAIAQRWAELPATLRWQFAFETDGTALVNRSLPELAGKRMALSFTPATPTDEETLASFIPPDATSPADLPTSLPAGVINLIAEYSIDGQTIARGGTYGLGTTVNTRQRLFEPGAGWREIDNILAAGDYQAVGLDVSGISIAEAAALQDQLQATKAKLDSQQFAGLSKHDLTGAILQAGIVGYFAQTWGKGQIMARTANVLLYRLPSVGTLSTASTVTFWFGVPRRFIPSGVAFDVDRNALSSAARDDDRTRWIAFNRSYNQILSAHEHSVLEDMFSTPDQPVLGVSTVKAIAVAAQQGQRIYTITQDNLSTALDQIALPSDVETDIANAVNAGFQVTTHQADIQYAGLVTAGYAIEDPNTGVGAMLISSGDAGGGAKLLKALGIVLFAILGAIATGILIVLALLLIPIFLAFIGIMIAFFIEEILIILGTLAIVHGLTVIGFSPGQITATFGVFIALLAIASIVPGAIVGLIFAVFGLFLAFDLVINSLRENAQRSLFVKRRNPDTINDSSTHGRVLWVRSLTSKAYAASGGKLGPQGLNFYIRAHS